LNAGNALNPCLRGLTTLRISCGRNARGFRILRPAGRQRRTAL